MEKLSYLKSFNASYIEELFQLYQQQREFTDQIDPSWNYFFDGLTLSETSTDHQKQPDAPTPASPSLGVIPPPVVSSTPQQPQPAPVHPAVLNPAHIGEKIQKELQIGSLIHTYRQRGQLLARVNPLQPIATSHADLELSHFGITPEELEQTYQVTQWLGFGTAPLREVLAQLRQTYCQSIGVEYDFIQNTEERMWLQQTMETARNQEKLDPETQRFVLDRLIASETFERFLHTRYVAQKRFSLEGSETLIPALDRIIERGAELGVQEFVIGMAHRGRLNVLTQVLGKKPEFILTEFEGKYPVDFSEGEGDVKYHMGFSSDQTTRSGQVVHLSLASNPSHLEFVYPVVEGMVRAKQAYRGDTARLQVVPIAIHGDASFAGQGICYETLNCSQLEGYKTGGTLHIIINNQVGFTTDPQDARSTREATALAKMLDSPIFHVNGDDPEAVVWVSRLALEYRQKFQKDVFMDLISYRKHGHNEGDEPAFTQPILYKNIKSHASVREIYATRLIDQHQVTPSDVDQQIARVTAELTDAQNRTRATAPRPFVSSFEGRWKGLKPATENDLWKEIPTQVSQSTLQMLAESLHSFPADFHIHPKLVRLFETRRKAMQEGRGIDWGLGETLAYASLLHEGHPVRLSGQDVQRGTFTHRHAVLHDPETNKIHVPLNHIPFREKPAAFEAWNSHLSESAILGFEYGYSSADPQTLVIWEAQFGDFANGAQVIIDQFITSGESKWQRHSGLTLLLPHGYEGQGAEHSSARLERFLQLAGRENIIVGNFTTPAQIFHALRRQVKREFRKPLVIMSPKLLLRHPQAVSSLSDFTDHGFQEVLDDPTLHSEERAKEIQKVLLCSGKIYYELVAALEPQKRGKIAIVRIEQLYPWPGKKLAHILARYPNATLQWVQEEPKNMGAWNSVWSMWMEEDASFHTQIGERGLQYIGRPRAAAPAVGPHSLHDIEHQTLIEKATLL